MSRVSSALLIFVLGAASVVGQTAGTGNAGAGLELLTRVGESPLDGSDKTSRVGQQLALNLVTDGSLAGRPSLLAFGQGVPGADPTFDLPGETGVVGLPIQWGTIWDGFANPLAFPVLAGAGRTAKGVHPCGNLGAQNSLYFQGACVDPAKPNGLALTVATEITFAAPGGITFIPSTDDGAFQLLTCPMAPFPFYGTAWSDLYLSANGVVTFGGSDGGEARFNPTEATHHLGFPRIAPLWTDLDLTQGGAISYEATPTEIRIEFAGVPAWGSATDRNSFQLLLRPDGAIAMSWLELAPTASADLVGIGPGGGLSAASEVDLSAVASPVLPFLGGALDAIYQHGGETGCGDTIRDLAQGSALFVPTSPVSYLYLPTAFPTRLDSVWPSSGAVLQTSSVVLRGMNFEPGSTVEFGAGNFATNVVYVDPCTITCDAPAQAAGTVDVIVTGATQSVMLPGGFAYLASGSASGPITLGNDQSLRFDLGVAPASLTFFDQTWTGFWVNANGSLTFDGPDEDPTPSLTEMLASRSRIAAAWSDLDPGSGGAVASFESTDRVSITFTAVPAPSGGTCTCQMTVFKQTGDVQVAYFGAQSGFNGLPGNDPVLVGLSPGGGAVAVPVDFTSGTGYTGAVNEAFIEDFNVFTPTWDLDGATILFVWNGAGYTF